MSRLLWIFALGASLCSPVGCKDGDGRKSTKSTENSGAARSGGGSGPTSAVPTCKEEDDFLTAEEKETLLKLARRSVVQSVKSGGALKETELTKGLDITDALKKEMGAFVTLQKHGKLRGCIGYLRPVAPLHKAVMANARSAALRDTRFSPVKPHELDDIEVEVSVLSVPVPVDGPSHIRIGCHGIILKKGRRRATFLPHVAPQQGWNREQTLSHLSRKAGLGRDGWKDGCSFKVYTALVFGLEGSGEH
jgi:AmmeMemoRadiSam system protein A